MPKKYKQEAPVKRKVKLKKGDHVIVLAGKDKGKHGEILRVLPSLNRAFVSGINMVKKHQRAGANGAGGMVSQEASIHISNLAMEDPKTKKATRVGYKVLENGEKVRIARASGETLA